nr:MAG TPA: Peptidase [Caudoviricetes sp.]
MAVFPSPTKGITGNDKLIDLDLLSRYHSKLTENVLDKKVDAVAGKQLSTNDYTTEEKEKLAGVAAGAQANVKPDWNAETGNAAEILNKPESMKANGGNADTVNGHTVLADVPENAKFTDTKYTQFQGAKENKRGSTGLVPAPAPSDVASYLRGDGTWAEIEKVTIGEAGENLGVVKTGGNVTIAGGIITVNDNGHAHTIANVTGLQDALDGKANVGDIPNIGNATAAKDGLMSSADFTKLQNIEEGANKTIVDASLDNQSDHAISNKAVTAQLGNFVSKATKINGVALDSENITLTADTLNTVSKDDKGVANGIATLDDAGKVPASQLPSYVDDVLEGYLKTEDGKFYKEAAYTTAYTPEDGKIYVDLSTNKSYRWSGSVYVEIAGGVALGETEQTAYRGDRGKIAYDHSQTPHAPADAEANVINSVKALTSDSKNVVTLADKEVTINLIDYYNSSDLVMATTGDIDAIFSAS